MPSIGGRHTRRARFAYAVPAVILVAMAAAPATARDQALHLFNANPSRSYTVLRNGATQATLNSSINGSLVFSSQTSPGDQFRIFETGGGATPPSIPTGVAASGDAVGCAHLSWNPNPETDVTLYRVYYGQGSGAYVDSIDATGTVADLCGLTDGTWYFAVRAHNSAGLLSGLSLEASASVSNGDAQPPVPPGLLVVRAGAPGCVDVLWNGSGDPTVVGYVVDYGSSSVQAGPATSYDQTLDAEASAFSKFPLDSRLLEAIEALGFKIPTPIQEEGMTPLLNGRDVIGRARTGSGKTAAYGLPLLELVKDGGKAVRALVFAPTRELAIQITDALRSYAIKLPIDMLTIYGGTSYRTQFRALARGVSVVVGTPGRILDHVEKGTLDLSAVEFFVIDEADEMLRMGFIDDVEKVLSKMPEERQLALFSCVWKDFLLGVDVSEGVRSCSIFWVECAACKTWSASYAFGNILFTIGFEC